jgi:putative heme-binding domain-containing protein
MDQKLKVVLGVLCAFMCFLYLSKEAHSQALPDGKGKAEFVHNCTACHRASMVTRVKKTPREWRKSVDEMAARGTDGTKEDLDNAYIYLVTNYAADKPSPTAATQSTTPSSDSASSTPASSNPSSPAALTSSELDHMKRIIAENGCLLCHRVEQQGAYTGPTLNGMRAQRTAAEIRTAIVSPTPTLDPSNNLVSLTTADGKTLVGRILSQDDRQVRVIVASGETATYFKSGLHQFTMINTNPMPSYERKITGEDLDGLVRYLGSLPSVDDSIHK